MRAEFALLRSRSRDCGATHDGEERAGATPRDEANVGRRLNDRWIMTRARVLGCSVLRGRRAHPGRKAATARSNWRRRLDGGDGAQAVFHAGREVVHQSVVLVSLPERKLSRASHTQLRAPGCTRA